MTAWCCGKNKKGFGVISGLTSWLCLCTLWDFCHGPWLSLCFPFLRVQSETVEAHGRIAAEYD